VWDEGGQGPAAQVHKLLHLLTAAVSLCIPCMEASSHTLPTALRVAFPLSLSPCARSSMQGALDLYCIPACFLQPHGTPPLLEQRLAPQLGDLAAGRPLAQRLAGTMQQGAGSIVHAGIVWYYPCPPLRIRVTTSGDLTLRLTTWQCLSSEGCSSLDATLQLAVPGAAAAAQRISSLTDSNGIVWALLHEETGFKLSINGSAVMLRSRPGWRRVLGSWSGWHLFKAEAVRGRIGPSHAVLHIQACA
jgi:hypothetical protein